MFFVFYILILISYVSDSSNFVLKTINQPPDDDVKQNYKQNILRDVLFDVLHITTAERSKFKTVEKRTNKQNSNLEVNNFDRRLSDEMLSMKQNIQGIDKLPLSELKSTQYITIPEHEFKQKWPLEDFFSKRDEIKHSPEDNDDLEFRYLFADEKDNESSINEMQIQSKSWDESTEKRNQSHGLARHALNFGGMTTSNHTCSRTPVCSPGDSTHQCMGLTKTVLTYTLMPFYLPYEPYFHQQPIFYTQPTPSSSFPPFEYIYSDDERDKEIVDEYSDEEYYENFRHLTTKRKKKKPKKDDDKNVDFEAKPRQPKLEWNTTFFENQPHKIVQDLIDGLAERYPDSTIRKCYCSAIGCNCPIIVMIVLFLCFNLF